VTKLQSLADHAAAFATKMFAERGEVQPMWIADTAGGKRMVIGAELRNKDDVIAGLRELFREQRVVRYAAMMEAWMVTLPDHKMPVSPPSEHPDRREILMIQAGDRKGRSIMLTYFILRPEHGPPQLKKAKTEFDHLKGRFANLLTRPISDTNYSSRS
jgi:hypothetical protein